MSESEVIYCEIVAIPPSEGGGFCARVPALGRTACRADGQTAMQALAALVAGLQPREHLSNLEIMNTPEGREWSAAIEASLTAGLADGVRPYAERVVTKKVKIVKVTAHKAPPLVLLGDDDVCEYFTPDGSVEDCAGNGWYRCRDCGRFDKTVDTRDSISPKPVDEATEKRDLDLGPSDVWDPKDRERLGRTMDWYRAGGDVPAVEAPPAPAKPLYEHDCDRCTYLGQFVGGPGTDAEEPVDLYVCAKFWKSTPVMVDVIVRYSDEGSDYSSYPSSIADTLPAQFKAVHECLRRYRERLENGK